MGKYYIINVRGENFIWIGNLLVCMSFYFQSLALSSAPVTLYKTILPVDSLPIWMLAHFDFVWKSTWHEYYHKLRSGNVGNQDLIELTNSEFSTLDLPEVIIIAQSIPGLGHLVIRGYPRSLRVSNEKTEWLEVSTYPADVKDFFGSEIAEDFQSNFLWQ